MQIRGCGTIAPSCVALFLAAIELRAQETAPLLTLPEAVLAALAGNERMLGSQENIEQAQLGRTLAESAFGTRITPNVCGSFGQSDVRNQTYGLGTSKRFVTGTEVRVDVGTSTFRNQSGSFYAADTTLLVIRLYDRPGDAEPGHREGRRGGPHAGRHLRAGAIGPSGAPGTAGDGAPQSLPRPAVVQPGHDHRRAGGHVAGSDGRDEAVHRTSGSSRCWRASRSTSV